MIVRVTMFLLIVVLPTFRLFGCFSAGGSRLVRLSPIQVSWPVAHPGVEPGEAIPQGHTADGEAKPASHLGGGAYMASNLGYTKIVSEKQGFVKL
jgi:hypothetical protein